MVNKTIILSLIFLVGIVFALSSVSAALGTVTIIQPASSSSITGTGKLNVSVANVKGNWSCIFYAKSASTANSSWAVIAGPSENNTNGIGLPSILNVTFDSTGLEDSNNYLFNATCYNNTDVWAAAAASGITINNNVPQTPSSLSPATSTLITSTTTQTFSSTVVDRNTTACTYVISRGGALSGADYYTGSGTYSGTSCSFTKSFTSSVDNGIWYWYMTASDGTDTASASPNQLQVSFPGSGNDASLAYEAANTATESPLNNILANKNLLLFIGIGIVAWLIFKKK